MVQNSERGMGREAVITIGGNQRKTNIELLRIVLMLMVIGVHYNAPGMGDAFAQVIPQTINSYILSFLESICIVCVNTYVIITGYFMIQSEQIRLEKVVRLLFLVLFYNALMYLLEVLCGLNYFSIGELAKNLIAGKWFITLYIVLYLLSIFINILVSKLSREGYRCFLIIMLSIFVVWPTILDVAFGILGKEVPVGLSTLSPNGGRESGYHIMIFITLYSIGGYLIKFYEKKKKSMAYLGIFFGVAVLIFGVSLFTDRVWDYDNLLVVANSVVIFLMFLNCKVRYHKWIHKVSATTLAVFIIHTSDFMNHIWTELKVETFCNSVYVPIHFLLSVLAVFVCCMIIDIIIRPIANKIIDLVFKIFPVFKLVVKKKDILAK